MKREEMSPPKCPVIKEKPGAETLDDVVAQFYEKHPDLKRKSLEQEFGKEKADEILRDAGKQDYADRKKLGDDY